MESDIALLVLRVATGVVFVAHGLQKLLGWWEGPGWEGWKGFIGFLGLRPAPFWASLSLVAELGGGLALIAGLLVPLAAAGLVAQSVVLTWRIHRPNGFWSGDGGIEFPIGFMAGAFTVQILGPGAWSLDAFLPVDVLYEPAVRWGDPRAGRRRGAAGDPAVELAAAAAGRAGRRARWGERVDHAAVAVATDAATPPLAGSLL